MEPAIRHAKHWHCWINFGNVTMEKLLSFEPKHCTVWIGEDIFTLDHCISRLPAPWAIRSFAGIISSPTFIQTYKIIQTQYTWLIDDASLFQYITILFCRYFFTLNHVNHVKSLPFRSTWGALLWMLFTAPGAFLSLGGRGLSIRSAGVSKRFVLDGTSATLSKEIRKISQVDAIWNDMIDFWKVFFP